MASDSAAVFEFPKELDQLEMKTVGQKLLQHLESDGFLLLRTKRIDQRLVEEAFSISAEYFNLPMEEKMKHLRPRGTDDDPGFIPPGYENLSVFDETDKERLEKRETFNFYPDEKERIPQTLPQFKRIFEELCNSALAFSMTAVECLALALELPDHQKSVFQNAHRFVGQTKKSTSKLRTLFYPPIEASFHELDILTRLASHTDYGTVTLLFQNGVDGLEVENRLGKYNLVKFPARDVILLQAGDLLAHWTSHRIHSPRHRITLNDARQCTETRQSLAFFLHPDNDAVIARLDGTHPEETIQAGAFIKGKFSASYS